ncbi:MAG: dihydrodipicolinate reductase C-terminal domain-containing protein, partial [Sediminibacterium sp.]
INKLLAKLMNNYPDYDVSMKEIHHTAKKDAPSGTAITLAEQVIEALNRKKGWELGDQESHENKIAIIAERIDPAPGTHHVLYRSSIDDIEIIHTAHNRTGFAGGALKAAEFAVGKKGIFSMKEVLGL